ncbi:MAG: 4Fe-4S dicluster domain-containing protein [Thaumarchaeota archaeon]|jgi:ferredoxin|nr:4Fe-4S dicluster domain-containing protein [Candidatus Geocrenenecus arthurdayi]MCL7388447.1 4Fe-4S dicluster domain-containing protein [Candidatus Geocrenenecus arthurdayi]
MEQIQTLISTKTLTRINVELPNTIIKLGAEKFSRCFNCGNCTAICPLTQGRASYPRKLIRYAVMGLEDRVTSSADPWLCYYCGECSDYCPRDADPGSFMMALRRYLTTKYDWTGLSRLLYLSKKIEVIAIASIAAIVGLLIFLLHGPIVLDKVELETFAPIYIVDTAGLVVFFILAIILLTNIYRMYRFIMRDEYGRRIKVPFTMLLSYFVKTVPIHFFTQIKLRLCRVSNWINHLITVYGYAAAFILFVPLLRFTQTNEPFLFVNPLSILGIFSTIALLYGATVAIRGRIKKTQPMWIYSHPTDWMFLILLAATVVTGILVGIFRTIGLPLPTYITYSIHLMIVAPFLLLEVPFAKWAHLAYRPFALYFALLKEKVTGGGGVV